MRHLPFKKALLTLCWFYCARLQMANHLVKPSVGARSEPEKSIEIIADHRQGLSDKPVIWPSAFIIGP